MYHLLFLYFDSKRLMSCLVCLVFIITFVWTSFAESMEGHPDKNTSKPIIVIDPGHGGHDFGVQGSEKNTEKHIAMTMAHMLATCLEGKYNPILTRTGDYWLDIPSRTSMANHLGAALFLSIHTGGSFLHKADGMTLFYYSDDISLQPESLIVSELSISDELTETTWNYIQNEHQLKSKRFAEMVQTKIAGNKNLSQSNVYEAPLMVLSGANMPAILIEIGYLTNPVEEKKMSDKSWMSNFAREICIGIDKFFEKEQE